jgi:hypothetical protein
MTIVVSSRQTSALRVWGLEVADLSLYFDQFDISSTDFYALNPQLNTDCTNLQLGEVSHSNISAFPLKHRLLNHKRRLTASAEVLRPRLLQPGLHRVLHPGP